MMRLDQYEGRIKRLIYDKEKTRLSMSQLQYVFNDKQQWSALYDQDSNLARLLREPYYTPEGRSKADPKPSNITMVDPKGNAYMDMHALLITGLLLCPGSIDLKVRVFYDLL